MFVDFYPYSAGKWEEAFELLDLMPSEGVKPDLTTCNIALDACVKVSRKYNHVFCRVCPRNLVCAVCSCTKAKNNDHIPHFPFPKHVPDVMSKRSVDGAQKVVRLTTL